LQLTEIGQLFERQSQVVGWDLALGQKIVEILFQDVSKLR
jgi:RAB protein geranylgeranyltransferase component A